MHWAAQTVGSTGVAFVPHEDDDSHTNMEWLRDKQLLSGQVTSTKPAFRVAVIPAELTLMMLDLEGDEIGRLELVGHHLDEGYDWLSLMIATLIEKEEVELHRPTYDLPHHAVEEGGTFAMGEPGHFVELGKWFANADLVLRAVREDNPEGSPVRCWPHHFDIATLIEIDGDAGKTVGVGMTPGDHNYAEPYWYVTPWPYPKAKTLPTLDVGTWHTEGWIGAVLTGTELVKHDGAAAQEEQTAAFLRAGIRHCRELVTG